MMTQQINLYHPIFRREQKLFSAITMVRIWFALLAVALLVTLFDAWQTRHMTAALKDALGNKRAAQARLQDADRLFGVEQARAKLTALEGREQALARLSRFVRESRRARVGPAPLFGAVATAIKPGLWVTHFLLDRKTRTLVLAGHSVYPALVPLFLKDLVATPALAGYRFRDIAITRVKLRGTYKSYVDFTASTNAPAARVSQPEPGLAKGAVSHGP